MNRNKIHIICCTFVCCVAVCSCMKENAEFTSLGYELDLRAKIADMGVIGTRADLMHNSDDITTKTFKLYAWEGSTALVDGKSVTYSSGKWNVEGQNPTLSKDNDYTFLSYGNVPSAGVSVTPPSSESDDITFAVTDITKAQTDVLLGSATANEPEDGAVTIEYSHPYASVSFILGNADGVTSVKSVSLNGVYASGKTTYSLASTKDGNGVVKYTWTDLGDANAVLESTGLTVTEGDTIATFMVIPQDLTSKDAVVTITASDDHTLTKLLNKDKWEAGYTTIYTLNRIGDVDIDISTSSGVTFKNSADARIYIRATITGAWYDASGNVVAPWEPTDGHFEGLPGSGWEADNGIYYYSDPIPSEGCATALYTSYTPEDPAPVAGATLKLNVLVQAIPYAVNKTCQEAFEALYN